jgi:hypothetical protein
MGGINGKERKKVSMFQVFRTQFSIFCVLQNFADLHLLLQTSHCGKFPNFPVLGLRTLKKKKCGQVFGTKQEICGLHKNLRRERREAKE